MSKQIDLSVTGGNDKTRFFFISGFYNDQDAIVINNTFKRYGGRFNLEHNASAKLSLGINVAVSRSQLNRVKQRQCIFHTGAVGCSVADITAVRFNRCFEQNTLYSNGLFDAQFNSDEQVTFRTLGNAFANYNIIPSLSFRSNLARTFLISTSRPSRVKKPLTEGNRKRQFYYFAECGVQHQQLLYLCTKDWRKS